MSKLNPSDIQGFVLRGYNMPYARYCFLHFADAKSGIALVDRLLSVITTGQLWDQGKPQSTVNIAFTHKGLVKLELPIATLISFPVEFQQGMRARGGILGDTGCNAPEHWDHVWRDGHVHAWLGINAISPEALESRTDELRTLVEEIGGIQLLDSQDAASIVIDGKVTPKEHFGYTDGFGNPDYLGICRRPSPARASWPPTAKRGSPSPPANSSSATQTKPANFPPPPSRTSSPQWHLHGLSQAPPERRHLPPVPRQVGRPLWRWGQRRP